MSSEDRVKSSVFKEILANLLIKDNHLIIHILDTITFIDLKIFETQIEEESCLHIIKSLKNSEKLDA